MNAVRWRPPAGWLRHAHRRPVTWIAVLAVALLVAALSWPRIRHLALPGAVTVLAAGDMACDPGDPSLRPGAPPGDQCRHQAVSDIAVALNPDFLVALGDVQYETPTATAYRTVYGPSFGRLRDRTVPVYGNQEYKVQDAGSFVAYFGDRIGDTRGYWSQEIGTWHLVVLNSNCSAVTGGCATGSPQQVWLADDLARAGARCVVAAWHHPRWSTGIAGSDSRTADLFRTLHQHRVELVLSGHDAHYERFAPLNADGRPDPAGVRQFVAGTGGQAHYRPETTTPRGGPVSEFADYDHHGVLELELERDGWQWRFHPLEADAKVMDEGRDTCR
jgi:hypothetical protein